MSDDILIPTDRRQRTEAALDHAIEIASQWGRTLHSLYVVDAGLARSGPALETPSREGHRAVRDIEVVRTLAGLPVVTDITRSRPRIADVADRHRAGCPEPMRAAGPPVATIRREPGRVLES